MELIDPVITVQNTDGNYVLVQCLYRPSEHEKFDFTVLVGRRAIETKGLSAATLEAADLKFKALQPSL